MKLAKANEVQFLFLCGTLDKQTFHVVKCTGTDTIAVPYEFTIDLRSSNSSIPSTDIINKPATLFMFRDGEYYPYSGVVANFQYNGTNTDYSEYSVRLVPQLWLLDLNIQTRVFQNMSVVEIARKVLDDANLSSYYTVDLQATYPQREMVVQYKESDLNFISRLLEEAGIWFFFSEPPLTKEDIEGVGAESMVISDKPGSFAMLSGESEIPFRTHGGLVQSDNVEAFEYCNSLTMHASVATQNVLVKSYNYRTPEVSLSAQKPIDSGATGTLYEYGGSFNDTSSAQKSAEQIAKAIATSIITIEGCGVCRGFRAGMRFTLSDHDRSDCNDTYLILSVAHTGAHASSGGGNAVATYTNKFTLLPSARIALYAPPRVHKFQPLNGIITAPIEANGSDYASLDDRGRYKVRFPFDVSESQNYAASKYIRLAQPYSGANYGIHFPSHEGSEMVLACIDGDPNKPLGIGTVPNANTISPVVSNNKEQSIIRTAGSNEILLDDTDTKQKIRITSASGNTMVLDDENKMLFAQTKAGSKLLIDDTNKITSLSADAHNFCMSYKSGSEGITLSSAKGHVIKIDDKGKKLTIQTSAGHVIQMDDDGKKMVLTDCKGKSTVTLDGSNGLILDTKGKLSISATQDVTIKGANVSLEASSGKVTLKAATDLALSGMNIDAKGSAGCKLKGLQVELSADTTMKIKGGAQTEVGSSGMTTVSGSGMLTLKGGIVMIN